MTTPRDKIIAALKRSDELYATTEYERRADALLAALTPAAPQPAPVERVELIREAWEAANVAWEGGHQWINSLINRLIDALEAAPVAPAPVEKWPDDLGVWRTGKALSDRCNELAQRLVRLSTAAPVPAGWRQDAADRLFAAIAHGDEAHRAWLKNVLEDWFYAERTTIDLAAAPQPPVEGTEGK